jgi:hypothetical protein
VRLTRDVLLKSLGEAVLEDIKYKNAPCGCESCAAPPQDAGAAEAKRFAAISLQVAIAEEVSRFKALEAWAPLSARFVPVFTFARMKFAIDASEAPAVMMVAASALPPGATGQYIRKKNRMLIRADLDDEEVESVICHEMAHAYEELKKGWETDENFASYMEHELMREWKSYR